MYPRLRKVKTNRLILFAVGVLLVAACRTPVDDNDQPGKKPADKTSLIEKIAEAQALYDSLELSDDGKDIDTDKYWVTSKWALKVAIDTAQGIANKTGTTAKEIQEALDALIEAYNTANTTKQRGIKGPENPDPDPDPVEVNKSALLNKIAQAEALAASLQTSFDGNDIPPNEKWVTEEKKSSLTGAIQAAKGAAANEDATAEEVTSALAELTAAYNEAIAAQKPGTTPDKTALIAKIDEAIERMKDVKPSNQGDGSEYRPDERWVTTAVYNALEDALDNAQLAQYNDNVTKIAVNAALENLTNALDNFNPESGISVADKEALNALIAEIADKLVNVQMSDDNGADVYDTDEWVTSAVYNALQAALEEARDIAGHAAATQKAVDEITEELQAVFDTFDPQPGKKALGELAFKTEFIKPGDETITLTGAQALSWVNNTELHITVMESFTSYQWYVDGIIQAGGGDSITLYARNFSTGTHTVTLKVKQGNVPYTKTLTFTVN